MNGSWIWDDLMSIFSFEIVMMVNQICTVDALQEVQGYVMTATTQMLCFFDARCNAVWAARACNIID